MAWQDVPTFYFNSGARVIELKPCGPLCFKPPAQKQPSAGCVKKQERGVLLNSRGRKDHSVRGRAENEFDRAELQHFFGPGIRSRFLTPFAYAVPILGLENGPDFGTVFVADRARIFGARGCGDCCADAG